MRDNSAETLSQFLLQEALGSSCGMSRDVQSLMLSIQQWAGPLDLYGKEDAPALNESPSYG